MDSQQHDMASMNAHAIGLVQFSTMDNSVTHHTLCFDFIFEGQGRWGSEEYQSVLDIKFINEHK